MYGKEEGSMRACIRLFAKQSLTLVNTAFVQIGINYKGSKNELNGCVNDAHNIRQFLISRFVRRAYIVVPLIRT